MEWVSYRFRSMNSPMAIGAFVGIVTLAYLILMSINPYLPGILLISLSTGYIVYSFQGSCQRPIVTTTTSTIPAITTTTALPGVANPMNNSALLTY